MSKTIYTFLALVRWSISKVWVNEIDRNMLIELGEIVWMTLKITCILRYLDTE